MNLHSPQLERSLRKATLKAIRASPTLRKEAGRWQRARTRNNPTGFGVWRLMGSAFLVGLMAIGSVHNATHNYALAIIAMWSAVTAFLQWGELDERLYRDASIGSLLLLPVPDGIIFRWQAQSFLFRSFGVWVDGVAAFTYLAVVSNLEPGGWFAVPVLATAQWLIVLALATGLTAYPLPALRAFGLLIPVSFLGSFLLFVDKKFVGPHIAAWIDASSPWLTLLLPTGWTATLFDRALVKHEWLAVSLAGPMLLILALGFRSWQRLRQSYSLNVTDKPEDDSAPEPEHEISGPPQTPRVGPTEVLDGIHAREFLQSASIESRGPLERLVFSRLTARDKLLMECMSAEDVRWSQRWRKAAWFMAGGMLASWLAQRLGQGWFGWIDGLTLSVAAGLTLSTGISINAALPGLLPASLGEIARLKAKVAFARSVSALPLFMIYGATLAWRLGQSPAVGASLGAKAIAILLAAVPFHVVVSISGGTDDTKRLRLRTTWMILVLVGCVLVILGCGAAAIITDFSEAPFWVGWALVSFVAVASWLSFACYQRNFNRCRFDLTQFAPLSAYQLDDSD